MAGDVKDINSGTPPADDQTGAGHATQAANTATNAPDLRGEMEEWIGAFGAAAEDGFVSEDEADLLTRYDARYEHIMGMRPGDRASLARELLAERLPETSECVVDPNDPAQDSCFLRLLADAFKVDVPEELQEFFSNKNSSTPGFEG